MGARDHITGPLIKESCNSHHSREIMLSGSTIDTFEARAERVTLNHAISVVSNLLGKDLYISSNRPLPIHLHSHEIYKFLDTRPSFCSTNIVKVQVSSILKGKKFRCDESLAVYCLYKDLTPGMPDMQSSSLSI